MTEKVNDWLADEAHQFCGCFDMHSFSLADSEADVVFLVRSIKSAIVGSSR